MLNRNEGGNEPGDFLETRRDGLAGWGWIGISGKPEGMVYLVGGGWIVGTWWGWILPPPEPKNQSPSPPPPRF